MNPISSGAFVYYVPGREMQGSSYIAICPATGFVGVCGDFISFTYVSHPDYRSEPLVPFLKRVSQSYLLTKAMGRGWQCLDFGPENRRLRREILRRRRSMALDKWEAREAYYDLDELDEVEHIDAWWNVIKRYDTLVDITKALELYPGDRYKPLKLADRFWNEVWGPFIGSLPDELGQA